MLNREGNRMETLEKARCWIYAHTAFQSGMVVTSKQRAVYQEVTGYYIPTLLKWGFHDLAMQYTEYLCNVQTEAGAWCAIDKISPYSFDTAQVLKGLLAAYPFRPEVKGNIIRGCDWLLAQMDENGRLTTPSKAYWGTDGFCSEAIHLYCLEPLRAAAELFDKPQYEAAALKSLQYYKKHFMGDIMNFRLLSHFQAYVFEALVDLGETKLARECMEKMERVQGEDGSIPALQNASWICSTGLFQMAVVWYKLGDAVHGDKAFEYACMLQNESGGWYGGYPPARTGFPIRMVLEKEKNTPSYFPDEEISWAVKYFFDAFYEKRKLHFESISAEFLFAIGKKDRKYQFILRKARESGAKIIGDIGCGKGRFLRNLSEDLEQVKIIGIDISRKVMSRGSLIGQFDVREGSILNIPYPDNYFDLVYVSEVLEHAIFIDHAVREVIRVVKPEGGIIIIDKNKEKIGAICLDECEQWFQAEEIKRLMVSGGAACEEVVELRDHGVRDGLFLAWYGRKRDTTDVV